MKYRVVRVSKNPLKDISAWEAFEQKVDALVEVGYSIRDFDVDGQYGFVALMKLDDPSKYENVDAVKKVPHHEAEDYLRNGWQLDSTFSNHVILIRRRE